jgi:hypothetical protein
MKYWHAGSVRRSGECFPVQEGLHGLAYGI